MAKHKEEKTNVMRVLLPRKLPYCGLYSFVPLGISVVSA